MARANNVTASGTSTAGRHGNPLPLRVRAIAVSIRAPGQVDKFANARQPRCLAISLAAPPDGWRVVEIRLKRDDERPVADDELFAVGVIRR